MTIKSLILGNQLFPVNIIQGPLAGVSCAPFRVLTNRYSQPAFTCTEMMSCKTLIHQPQLAKQRYLFKDKAEGKVCFQLSSNNPKELAEAVQIASDNGADLIDLNCGCPVKKIRARGAGSSLLTNATVLYQLISAMKSHTSLPVSIKIRVQGGEEKFNQEIAQVVSDAGADFLIVHGRHWTEDYATPCRYPEIKFFVDNLKIPVIGNGDIADRVSLQSMLNTGCAGVMIARAGVGQPWLIDQLIAEILNKPFIKPSSYEIGLIFIEHVLRLSELLGSEKFAILQARKFAKYYAREKQNKLEFCEAINQCLSVFALKEVVKRYFFEC